MLENRAEVQLREQQVVARRRDRGLAGSAQTTLSVVERASPQKGSCVTLAQLAGTVLNRQGTVCNLLISLQRTMLMKNTSKKCQKTPVRGKLILVVDDDIELLMICQGLLEANDYEACLAQNGAQALNLIKNRKVDAILCDLCMPGLPGDVLYWEVGRARPRLLKRFIFVTGNAENPTYEDFLKRTKASVLSKPLPINRLLKKLDSVLSPQARPSN